MCRAAVLRSLRGMRGVAEVAPGRGGATVAYDPGLLTPDEIAQRVTRESGYPAKVLAPAR